MNIKINDESPEKLGIKAIYHRYPNLIDRVDYYSGHFLGRPYLAGAQGEGLDRKFDDFPLYRFDAFDCVTYVNNVLALSLSSSEEEFIDHLLKLNYYHSKPIFENRFHFMSCDWNIQNQKNGFVEDVTNTVTDKQGEIISAFVEGEIDKPSWYSHQNKPVPENAKKVVASIHYLPLSSIFDSESNACQDIFTQIPHGAIVEIVRPNWDLKDKIGTTLHVSHLGFVIKNALNELCFRHASSNQEKVVEVLLGDYLSQYIESDTIKGINIQKIKC